MMMDSSKAKRCDDAKRLNVGEPGKFCISKKQATRPLVNRWLESYLVHSFHPQVPFRRQPIRRRRQEINQGVEFRQQLRNPGFLKLTRNSTTTITLARMHRQETGSTASSWSTRSLKSERVDTPSQLNSFSHPTFLTIWHTISANQRSECGAPDQFNTVLS
jgi:hypothetical protein